MIQSRKTANVIHMYIMLVFQFMHTYTYIDTHVVNVFILLLCYFTTIRYSDYEVYGDDCVAQSAQTHSRYSLLSLFRVIFDVFMLADSDYLVCTFSSNVSTLYMTHYTWHYA